MSASLSRPTFEHYAVAVQRIGVEWRRVEWNGERRGVRCIIMAAIFLSIYLFACLSSSPLRMCSSLYVCQPCSLRLFILMSIVIVIVITECYVQLHLLLLLLLLFGVALFARYFDCFSFGC